MQHRHLAISLASRLSVLMRFPRSDSICGRSHDDTPDSGSSELVIKDIPKAACLVTAYKRIGLSRQRLLLNAFDKGKDFFIIRTNLNLS